MTTATNKAQITPGQLFGKWKVIEYAGRKRGDALWLVECSCAKHTRKVVVGYHLVGGGSQSCGECPNDIEIRPNGVIVIKLVRRDGTIHNCFINAEDYPLVKDHWWHARKHRKTYYAITNDRRGDRWVGVRMHRLIRPDILGEVDHRNRNGLDNRRRNLRPASDSQSGANRVYRRSSSGYIGVYWIPKIQKFYAVIRVHGKNLHLGCFSSAKSAARVRDRAVKKRHGAFAVLNFPPKQPKDFILERKLRKL
jgi:hypothetical protein